MRSHYDLLGVAPDAGAEDIRRAYLDLARVLHPDRTGRGAGEEGQRAARRMQEVNEAWRVLRDPARRAAYDRALVGSVPPVRTDAGGPDAEPDLDTPFPSRPAEPGDLGVSVVRALPWVALLVVLGTIFVFTAFAGNRSEPRVPERFVGRCISTGPASAIVAVPCDGPNEGEVVLVVSRASLCPDGATSRPVGSRYLCLQEDERG